MKTKGVLGGGHQIFPLPLGESIWGMVSVNQPRSGAKYPFCDSAPTVSSPGNTLVEHESSGEKRERDRKPGNPHAHS
eukprot:6198742-Pleurochrysis_carterae.AAC.1